MNISDIIKRRRSVRTFTGTMPPEDIMTELQLRVDSTACDHYQRNEESALRCALEAEKIVLYLTSVNIGTCWVAGTFNQSKVQHAADTRENEHVVAVIPFGIAAPKRRLIESLQSGLQRSPVTDNKYTMLDMGIALAHFVLMADSSGVAGRLVIPHHPISARIAEWMPGDK